MCEKQFLLWFMQPSFITYLLHIHCLPDIQKVMIQASARGIYSLKRFISFFLPLTLKTLCCFLAKLDGPKPDTILRTVWSCIPSNFPFLNWSWHSPHDTQQSASWASHYAGVFLTTSGPNHQNLVLSALCPQFLQNSTSWQDESISCHTVFMMPGTFWWCVHVLLCSFLAGDRHSLRTGISDCSGHIKAPDSRD